MGKGPTPHQKVNEKSAECIHTRRAGGWKLFRTLRSRRHPAAAGAPCRVERANEVMAVQIGPREVRTSRTAQEGNAARLGAKLPDTHADAHCCDRPVNGAADLRQAGKTYIFTSGWWRCSLCEPRGSLRKPGQEGLEASCSSKTYSWQVGSALLSCEQLLILRGNVVVAQAVLLTQWCNHM